MGMAGGNGHNLVDRGRDRRAVPTYDGAVGFEGQHPLAKGVHGYNVRGACGSGWNITPMQHSAIVPQRHCKGPTSGHGHEIRRIRGDVKLTETIVAPTGHAAVYFQHESVISAGVNGERGRGDARPGIDKREVALVRQAVGAKHYW